MAQTVPNETDLHRLALLLRVLAHPTRLAICVELAEKDCRVTDLVERLHLAQSTVSGNLARLRESGLVVGRPEGRQVVYSLTCPDLIALLGDASRLSRLVDGAHAPTRVPQGGPSPRPGSGDLRHGRGSCVPFRPK